MTDSQKILEQLEAELMTFGTDKKVQNIGSIEKIGDGVVTVSGLSRAFMGEIIEVGESLGVVFNLDEDYVSLILLDNGEGLKEGDLAKTTGKILSINVSDDVLGRVLNPLGFALDGKPKPKKGIEMPLEKIAPGVVERESVNTPLKTGIKAIDAMIPIGRGQRELIIGDRGLGKTAIAIDTIINQRPQKILANKNQKRVICIYIAIGQKQSSIAQVIDRLKSEEALSYSVVIASGASDPAALQYLAPYSGTAIAEYFMEKGEDVLVVHDDLTKHAWAYRQLSLVLKRPAGREAYPGDIFYLHSRLLERAAKLNKKNGGGSITALPIIETQADDMSAYIPTNVISITDGQIYLQADLFNSGLKPAINAGSSVSRVGGSAQTSTIKFVSGKMRLDLAQYRDLAAFAQFGSDLDQATTQLLERGKRIMEILKQPQYHPLPEALQVVSIWVATNGHLDDIPVSEISRFEKEYHEYLKSHDMKLLEDFSQGQKPTDEQIKKLHKLTQDFKKIFTP